MRKYEIQIRRALNSQMQGDFRSIFKGSGLEFDDVRSYQYGDDVRTINWNVTAKGHGTYVKTFREEKEQIVYFILDISASQEIGSKGRQKMDIGKEICGILAVSAIKESSQVGLLAYTDRKEKFIKPGKGANHAYEILANLYRLKPQSKKTDLASAFKFALNIIKRKSVIILISDFIDTDYRHNLKALARRHDLVVIQLSDLRESNLPNLGLVPLKDKESGRTIWVNTAGKRFREKMQNRFSESANDLADFCMRQNANYLSVRTDEDYVPKLIKLFKVRNKVRSIA